RGPPPMSPPPMTDGYFPGGWFISGEGFGAIGRIGIVETDAFSHMPTNIFSKRNDGLGGGGTISYAGLFATTIGPLTVSLTPMASFDVLDLKMNQGFPNSSNFLGETVKAIFTA